MSPETHRAALRAAAKLALSALAIGCTTTAASEVSSSSDLTTAQTDAGPSKEVTAYCAETAPDASPRECCDTQLASATFAEDGGTDSLTLGCCDVLIHSAMPWSSEQLGACCWALGTPRGPACTPWGPPVPPAMDWKAGAPTAHVVLAA